MNANNCIGSLPICAVNTSKLSVPLVPYKNEIPINKIPEENAEDRINFIAASDDLRFAKSKLAAAANGIVLISSPK